MSTSASTDAPPEPIDRRRGRAVRLLGSLMAIAGIGLLAWCFVVWQWNDPFTALYTRWEQRKLDAKYEEVLATIRDRAEPVVPAGPRASVVELGRAVATSAQRFRHETHEGMPIGRIIVPRLGLRMVMVDGTRPATLRKGPGRHLSTYMPGEGRLVYIAGHRTTYLAPFAHIERLQRGDRITLEMPYATVVYAVTGHRIVDDEDLSVLRSKGYEQVALQACHPRFFATHRYIVWGTPVEVIPARGRPYRPRAQQ